jgi:hypothetical protein
MGFAILSSKLVLPGRRGRRRGRAPDPILGYGQCGDPRPAPRIDREADASRLADLASPSREHSSNTADIDAQSRRNQGPPPSIEPRRHWM